MFLDVQQNSVAGYMLSYSSGEETGNNKNTGNESGNGEERSKSGSGKESEKKGEFSVNSFILLRHAALNSIYDYCKEITI